MICAFDGSSMLSALRRLCGQPSTGPSGVFDQSSARMRSPISPPPARKSRLAGSESPGSLFDARAMRVQATTRRGRGWRGTRPHRASVTQRDGGADGRIRTGDLLITNQLLYQLSYVGERCGTASVSGPEAGFRDRIF